MEAILLDGEQRSALAAARSLGRSGIRVTVGSQKEHSLASCSRFCRGSFRYPPPARDPDGFLDAVIAFLEKAPSSVLLPMTDVTLSEILRNRERLPDTVRLPFVEHDTYRKMTDKAQLFRMARRLGVSMPETVFSEDCPDREAIVRSAGVLGYPVVVKPAFSKVRTAAGWRNAGVRYATDEESLEKLLSSEEFRLSPFLLQEKVVGPGVGVFLLMKDGKVLADFAHKRIREKPPSGGVSVLCESIEPPRDALAYAIRLLAPLAWTGVAMVEFKLDRSKKDAARLIEVNARFWGSLQLAVASGVDFPYLLFRLACDGAAEGPKGYTTGLRSRWELGDCDHLLLRILKKSSSLNLPPGSPSRARTLCDFLSDFFRPSVRNEVLDRDDPKPFLHELKSYFRGGAN